jgi:hypothetical protein
MAGSSCLGFAFQPLIFLLCWSFVLDHIRSSTRKWSWFILTSTVLLVISTELRYSSNALIQLIFPSTVNACTSIVHQARGGRTLNKAGHIPDPRVCSISFHPCPLSASVVPQEYKLAQASPFFFLLLFKCAYKTWVISSPCPHPLPYHPLRPLPLPPPPQYPAETILPLFLILL